MIKEVQNRLVINIPKKSHDLQSTKFYLLLHSFSPEQRDPIVGNIFLARQFLYTAVALIKYTTSFSYQKNLFQNYQHPTLKMLACAK